MASRLSEISHWNVLLIEAGGNENAFSDIPGLRGANGVSLDWQYKTEPQENCFLGILKVCTMVFGNNSVLQFYRI